MIEPTGVFVRRVRWALAASCVVCLAACAPIPRAAPAEAMRELKTIEIIVEAPRSNFNFQGPAAGAPGPGVAQAAGSALSLIVAYAGTTTAREGAPIIERSVSEVDVARTFLDQLSLARNAGAGGPTILASSAVAIDSLEPLDDGDVERRKQRARSSNADAVLFVRVRPTYQTRISNVPTVLTFSSLYTKSGGVHLWWWTSFRGPASPDGDRADVISWWADGRYRRFLLHGIRAGALPLADRIWNNPLSAREIETLERLGRRPTIEIADAQALRTDACALDGSSTPVIYRYDWLKFEQSVVALCAGNEKTRLPPGQDPLEASVTSPVAGLPTPVLKN